MIKKIIQRTMASTNLPKPQIIFVLGGPGSGKGTQCEKIVKNYNYIHLSAGELLREERKNPNSQVGQQIEDICLAGGIVPDTITCSLLEKAMNGYSSTASTTPRCPDASGEGDSKPQKFLIDGYPRNQDNLQGWYKNMGHKTETKFVLFFDCSQEKCVERLVERAKTSGRFDDEVEVVKRRFKTYFDVTMPIIGFF